MQQEQYDVIVIGGGPAGLTAAIYTSRAFLKTLVLAGSTPGGQLTTTTEVENFPGFVTGITGPELVSNMRAQAERFKTTFVDEDVSVVEGNFRDGFKIVTAENNIFMGKTIIVATGASAKWLDIPSETKLRGKGVSACATCDGFFFKDKNVAVVGGGDAAMEEATFLTKFSNKVYVLVRGDKDTMKASKIMQERALSNPKVTFLYNTGISEVLGDTSVTGLRIVNNNTFEESILDDVQGLFIAIGHRPNTDFIKNFVETDHVGYIKVHDGTKSSVEGVFVAGDVSDYRYRQAITAAGFGCMASIDAIKFLEAHEHV